MTWEINSITMIKRNHWTMLRIMFLFIYLQVINFKLNMARISIWSLMLITSKALKPQCWYKFQTNSLFDLDIYYDDLDIKVTWSHPHCIKFYNDQIEQKIKCNSSCRHRCTCIYSNDISPCNVEYSVDRKLHAHKTATYQTSTRPSVLRNSKLDS